MRARVLLGLIFLSFGAVATPSGAYERVSRTEQVTVSSQGTAGDGEPDACSSSLTCSADVAISADGRIVAFNSAFTNLVPSDTNETRDVFVRDLATGTTERVSIGSDGTEANGPSASVDISDDGRFVSFASQATNLAPGTPESGQVYIRDRVSGTTEVASISPAGSVGVGRSDSGRLSADGRFVAFWSAAFGNNNAVNGGGTIFVRDRVAGVTELVMLTDEGGTTEGVETYRSSLAISADGRFIAFETRHHNLTPGDVNGNVDIFVRDRVLHRTERISVDDDGNGANWVSYSPSISADGRYVAFYSAASNLVPADGNSPATSVFGGTAGFDIFVRDRLLGKTERVSVSSTGAEADQGATFPAISADGRYVVFSSGSTTLAPGATTYVERVYRHDRRTGETIVASTPAVGGHLRTAFSSAPAISDDGATVAFAGDSPNTGFEEAAYVARPGGPVAVMGASHRPSGGGLRVTGTVAVSGVEVAAGTDPRGDAEGDALGGDLLGARIVARHEQGDILFEITPSELPRTTSALPGTNYLYPGRPEVTVARYVASFTAEGTVYEVRAEIDPAAGTGARFALHGCSPTCARRAPLSGSWGGRGTTITIALPDEIIHLEEMTAITITAETPGATDALTLGDASIPSPTVSLGTSAGGPVTYVSAAAMADDAFDGTITDTPAEPFGVWVRLCYGSACDTRQAG